MLDQQRRRSSAQNQGHANFARAILFAHLVVGGLAAGLFVFHEKFFASLVTLFWYLNSIGLIVGMCRMLQWCRITLGLWFLCGGVVAMIFVALMPPVAPGSDGQPALSVQLIPIWLSTLAVGYLAAGAVMLLSPRIERATAHGFSLWQPSSPW